MRNRLGVKFGDTLIEVTLAIGIFSLIAVGVVSVVSGSTSRAQVALEQTLAREEIDSQAEALRFIQSSYVNSKTFSEDPDNSDYTDIWHTITAHAKTKMQVTDDILKFQPSTCAEIYEGNNLSNQGAFILNTRRLSSLNTEDVVIFAKDSKVFYESPTYPHIIYGASADDDPLLEGDMDADSSMTRAEGIYIVAVKDPDSTNIVNGDDSTISKTAAYYDFYIRACWYRPGAEQPTTISTVMRLYDPDAIEVVWPEGPDDPEPTIPDDDPEDPTAICRATNRPKTLQEYTSGYCSRCATDEEVTLTDKRDGKAYTVRYIAGNCWMTSNLSITGEVHAEYSNFSGRAVNVSEHDLTEGNSFDEPRSHVGATGVYYNFAAASAGTITGDRNMTNETANDICPKKWKLPSYTQKLTVMSQMDKFKPTGDGRFYDGVLEAAGEGYWWGSSRDSGQSRTAIFYRNGGLTDGGGSRAYGFYIRCIMN